jgi:glycosyltransferase involved in cell wall biosynthesis
MQSGSVRCGHVTTALDHKVEESVPRMKRLAIISSYNEACGNATYTHALQKEFSKHYEVEVIPLDLFLLQSQGKLFVEAGNRHIREICKKLKSFDFVNIQFEAGLFGVQPADIVSRVETLISASKSLVFTFHRIDLPVNAPWLQYLRALKRMDPRIFLLTRKKILDAGVYVKLLRSLREYSRKRNVWLMVHTKREARILRDIFGFQKVKDFPITFLTADERDRYIAKANRASFIEKLSLPGDAKTLSAFGFISGYKGLETLIRTLRELPSQYRLLIFGSQHPQSIQVNVEIDPYLESLLDEIDLGPHKPQLTNNFFRDKEEILKLTSLVLKKRLQREQGSIRDRVIFFGNLPDDDFINAMICSDAIVLPYVETGQSMSGVASLALETKARSFFSNNYSFRELTKYYGRSFHTFDIGNYKELAWKIENISHRFDAELDERFMTYNIERNVAAHRECWERSVE